MHKNNDIHLEMGLLMEHAVGNKENYLARRRGKQCTENQGKAV